MEHVSNRIHMAALQLLARYLRCHHTSRDITDVLQRVNRTGTLQRAAAGCSNVSPELLERLCDAGRNNAATPCNDAHVDT